MGHLYKIGSEHISYANVIEHIADNLDKYSYDALVSLLKDIAKYLALTGEEIADCEILYRLP